MRVCAGGDVTLGTNLDPFWAKYAADTLFRQFGLRPDPDSLAPSLTPFLAGADVVLLNIEGAIGAGEGAAEMRSQVHELFRLPPTTERRAALRRIVDSSVVMVGNVANNLSHDAGNAGRELTIESLRAAGIRVTGSDTLATPRRARDPATPSACSASTPTPPRPTRVICAPCAGTSRAPSSATEP